MTMEIKFLKANGSYDTKINDKTSEYEGITWAEIVKLTENPQQKEKLEAAFIIPSTYRNYDGRGHEAQRLHGEYYMLAIDVDSGNLDINYIIGGIETICGDVAMIGYSSSSATPDDRKWRVMIPIKEKLNGEAYSLFQIAFFELLGEKGINCDYVLSRNGQVIYLPNVPSSKRDENNKPVFYQYNIRRAKVMNLTNDHPISIRATENRVKQEEAHRVLEEERKKRQIDKAQKLAENPDQIFPIDEFNARHSVEDMLLRYGYDRLGGSDQWKSPHQTTKSYATKNYGDYWVSMSGTDAANGVGNLKGNDKAAYCWGDAFTLFCHYEHDGNIDAAVKSYGQEINPTKQKKAINPFEEFQEIQKHPKITKEQESVNEQKQEKTLLNTVFLPKDAQPILQANYLIKGWLGKQQMSVIYGPSNVGKSFLCLDMAWCVASNENWQGARVNGGAVLYLATEGGLTFHNRIYALTEKYGRSDVPLYIRPSPVDLLHPEASLKELGMLCQEIEQQSGKISLIVVDTLSRAMAGGNENGPEDMTAFIANVDALREFTKAHIMIVHHSGKDTAAGARGHSSLRAATDAEIELHVDDNIRFARATKQRDMETGSEFAFKLKVISLGMDQDGDDVTTVTINKAEEEDIKDAKRKPPTKNANKAINAFRQLRDEKVGEKNPSGAGWPESGRYWCIDIDKFKEYFLGQLTVTNKSGTWSETINWLENNGYIHINDNKIGFITKDFILRD